MAPASPGRPPSAGASKRPRPPEALADEKPAKRLRMKGLHAKSEYQEAAKEPETVQNSTVAEKFYGKGLVAAKEGLHADALENFRTGAALGSVNCMIELAVCLAGEEGCPQDSIAALALVKQARKLLGSSSFRSLNQLGADVARVHYNLGISAFYNEEHDKGVEWLQKAADTGHAGAQYELGRLFEIDEEDLEEAVAWYRKAANQGHAGALVALGVCYRFGKGVAENIVEAAALYRKAAEAGDATAQFKLGACYANGRGVPQDAAEAVAWYKVAAAQGHVNAQYNLALCYDDGDGLAQSKAEAAAWYKRAAEQGHVKAQYNLAISYEYGVGVAYDLVESAKWYKKAAEQGDSEAMYALGMDYKLGFGVPLDAKEALVWYEKAAELGHAGARSKVEDLRKEKECLESLLKLGDNE